MTSYNNDLYFLLLKLKRRKTINVTQSANFQHINKFALSILFFCSYIRPRYSDLLYSLTPSNLIMASFEQLVKTRCIGTLLFRGVAYLVSSFAWLFLGPLNLLFSLFFIIVAGISLVLLVENELKLK